MRAHLKSALLIASLASNAPLLAADHTINMLDTGDEGNMVFEPSFLNANVGDTITFVSKDMGHNVISRVVPDGAQGWKGNVSQGLTITLDKEGVYLYECDLHKMLGMFGVIQVGKPVNLDAAKAAAAELNKKVADGTERLDEYLAKVK